MSSTPSLSPVLKQATELAQRAAGDYLNNGTDPSLAIAKFGNQLYSDKFTDLVVSRTNQKIFQHIKSAGDKRAEYPVALSAKVKEAMQPTTKVASDTRVSSVWHRDIDWLDLSKTAVTRHDDFGREITTVGTLAKVAEPRVDNSEIIERQLQRDYWNSQRAADLEKQAEVEDGIAFSNAVDSLREYVKTASDHGEPVFETAFNIVANCESEKKASIATLADWCVNLMAASGDISKEAFDEYQGSVKTAALDWLDNGYPVMRGGDKVVFQLNTMVGAMERQNRGGGERHISTSEFDKDNYFNPGGDDRMKYKVDGVYKPRESQPLVQRDATIRGRPLF